MKIIFFALILVMGLTLTACSSGNNLSNSTFPQVKDADIPDILEKTVGTVGNTYYTSFGKSDNKDYQTYFMVTFEKTTEADYITLMEHYQTESTGIGEDGSLLFDWGWLIVTTEEDSITINAYFI